MSNLCDWNDAYVLVNEVSSKKEDEVNEKIYLKILHNLPICKQNK